MGVVIEKENPMTSCTGSPTLDWLLYEAPTIRDVGQLLEEFCNRLVAEDVPVARGLAIIPALHPLYFGTAYIWRGTGAIERRRGLWENRNSPEYRQSPILGWRCGPRSWPRAPPRACRAPNRARHGRRRSSPDRRCPPAWRRD